MGRTSEKKHWDEFWSSSPALGDVYANDGRVVACLAAHLDLRGARVLEVGAGTGRDSLELARPFHRHASAIREAVRAFFRRYLEGEIPAAVPGAVPIGLRRVHLGAGTTDVDVADLPEALVAVPRGDGADTRGSWGPGPSDADAGQRLLLDLDRETA